MISTYDIAWGVFFALAVALWRNLYTIIDPTHKVAVERVLLHTNSTLWQGKKIVQLSDMHAHVYNRCLNERIMQEALDVVQAEKPALVVLTGDFVVRDWRGILTMQPFLRRLVESAPHVVAVMGNHDARYKAQIEQHIEVSATRGKKKRKNTSFRNVAAPHTAPVHESNSELRYSSIAK